MSWTELASWTRTGLWLAAGALVPHLVVAQSVPQWRLAPDLRIGGVEDEDYAFINPGRLAVAEDGRIFLSEGSQGEVLVFGADGAFLRRFGGRGTAPGQFQTIRSLGWKADTLWAIDPFLSKVVFFDSDGEVRSEVRIQTSIDATTRRPVRPTGRLADGSIAGVTEVGGVHAGSSWYVPTPILRLRAEGVADSLGILLQNVAAEVVFETSLGPRVVALRSLPRFADRWAVAPRGDRIAILRPGIPTSTDAEFTMEVVEIASGQVVKRSFEYTPRRLSHEEQEGYIGGMIQSLVGAGLNRVEANRLVRDHISVAGYQLPIARILFGSDGLLWVERTDIVDSEGDLAFSIIDAKDGREVARAVSPVGTRFRLLAADSEAVWGIETDAAGTPYLVRYRIVRDPSMTSGLSSQVYARTK